MTDDEGGVITPREYDYWKLIYSELVLLPDWSELSAESRAHKLLERIDEKPLEADAPAQRKALFTCPPEEKLKTGMQDCSGPTCISRFNAGFEDRECRSS